MDASIQGREAAAAVQSREGRAKSDATPALDRSGLRVALVHDWLTGMRGGEKCLEVLCRAFPQATLYTLLHRRGSTSPAIESMAIRTSPLQRVPGIFRHYRHLLPLMPMAARAWKPRNIDLVVSLSHCVAKAVRVPAGFLMFVIASHRCAMPGTGGILTWKAGRIGRSVGRLPVVCWTASGRGIGRPRAE